VHRHRHSLALVPLLVAGLALAGCSSDSEAEAEPTTPVVGTSPTTEPEPEPEVVAPLTQAEAEALLLTAADVPAGWTQLPASGNSEDTFAGMMANTFGADPFGQASDEADTDVYAPAECADALSSVGEPAEGTTPTATAFVLFASPDGNQLLVQTVQSADGPSVAEANVASFATDAARCPSFTSTDADGAVTQNTLTPLTLPAYGDVSGAIRAEAAMDAGAFSFSMVVDTSIIGSGPTTVNVIVTGFGGVDDAALGTATAAAAAKLPAA
jgi:hypothetical protein